MTKIELVTTFSPSGWRQYGEPMCRTASQHAGVVLHAWHEGQEGLPKLERVVWHDLRSSVERAGFLERYGSDPEMVGTPADANTQGVRFAHKVFALSAQRELSYLPGSKETNWLVWVDADVQFTATPDWSAVLPESKALVYLGRSEQNPPWTWNNTVRPMLSETGFVGYRLDQWSSLDLIDRMASFFRTGECLRAPAWRRNDAGAFDLLKLAVPAELHHNLSSHVRGSDVWPHTVLAKFSRHHKGPRRKAQAYGPAS